MWFILLLALAIAAYFIVKIVKSQSVGDSDSSASRGSDAAHAGQDSLAHTPPTDALADSASGTAARSATVAGAATAAAATAAVGNVAAVNESTGTSAAVRSNSTRLEPLALDTGNPLHDISEMMKILNLAEPDARRLGISGEQLMALRSGQQSGALPSNEEQQQVAEKLRQMLA